MSTLKTTNLQHASAASPAIVLAADGTATAQLSSVNDGAIAGTRNRIINGGMDVWQRGTSTTATGNTYLADRWQSAILSTGGTISQETSSLPTGSRYAWKYVASASNTVGMQMGQQIEYVNCLDLQNTTVSISFMARSVNTNAASTALTVRTRTIAGVDGACMFGGTNSDTAVTLTTTWTRYTVTRTLPATFGSLSLEFAIGSHVSGDGIMLSQVQLEPGSVATPFERRSFGQELALCQRYYQKSYNIDVAPGALTRIGGNGMVAHATSSYMGFGFVTFQSSMRVNPTVTPYNPDTGLTTNPLRNYSASTNGTMAVANIGVFGFSSNANNLSISTNQSAAYHWTASAEL